MLNLLGPVAGAVFKTIDKVVDNKGEADKLKAKVQEKIIAGELAELEGAAKTIQIEAQGGFLLKKLATNYDVGLCWFNGSSLVWIYCTKHSRVCTELLT